MKKFVVIWIGELVSSIGSGMTAFAISIYIYGQTGSATLVSMATLLAFLPTVLLSPVGGILADRYDRRLMMILGDSLSVIGLIIAFIGIQTGWGDIPAILIGITISSVFVSLIEPSFKATVTDLLSEDEYARASGLIQIAGSSRYLVSPVLAGFILSVSDIRLILIIDMATIIVTVLTLLVVRKNMHLSKPCKKEFNFFKSFRKGIEGIAQNTTVKSLTILMTLICFFIAFLQTLLTPMVLALSDVKTLGVMETISSVGMLIGSVIIGILNIRSHYSHILKIALMAAGISMALSGTTCSIWGIGVFCFFVFLSIPFANTCADVLVRTNIPNDIQGRVWGIISIITQSGFIAAYAISGFLADYVFEPAMANDGFIAKTAGRIIGTGKGRGIGLMLVLAGILMFSSAFFLSFDKSVSKTEGGKIIE